MNKWICNLSFVIKDEARNAKMWRTCMQKGDVSNWRRERGYGPRDSERPFPSPPLKLWRGVIPFSRVVCAAILREGRSTFPIPASLRRRSQVPCGDIELKIVSFFRPLLFAFADHGPPVTQVWVSFRLPGFHGGKKMRERETPFWIGLMGFWGVVESRNTKFRSFLCCGRSRFCLACRKRNPFDPWAFDVISRS